MASAVDEIKERLNIEDVIGQYVQLKRAGRNFKGLSPFTSERTPSFVVSPEKQIWHDFSSGKGGNMFSFVMEVEGLDFKGALELLARQAGVDITQYQSKRSADREKEKARLYELLELATKFYQTHLKHNEEALTYLSKKRQLTKETVVSFRIGYSPNNGTALVDFLKKHHFSSQEMKAAGLATTRRAGLGDMFVGRIMIPLADSTGRIIGFTARLLQDQLNAPKYINTPQTLLYDKSRHVFGLHLAKEAIRRVNYVVLVEGNMDVIASHQAGVAQTVATAGTALTEHQLKALHRLTGDVRLAFDQDKAGVAASERAIPIASKVGVSLSMIGIPSGKDPDELIRHNTAAWQMAIEQPVYALDWLIDRYQELLDMTSGQGKKQFSDIIMSVISGLKDPVEQEHYISKVAELIGVSAKALQSKLGAVEASPRRRMPNLEKVELMPIDQKNQDHFLALMVMRPELRLFLEPMQEAMVQVGAPQQLFTYLKTHLDEAVAEPLPEELHNLEEYIKILAVQYEELYGALDSLELHYESRLLQAQLIQHYVKIKKQALATELQQSDDQTTPALLAQAKELDKLLKLSKGVMHE